MDAKTKNKFYYLKGQALYAGGAGAIGDYDKALILRVLVDVQTGYVPEITKLKQEITNSLLEKGNAFYEKKNYFSAASKYFEKAYRVTEKDTTYLVLCGSNSS